MTFSDSYLNANYPAPWPDEKIQQSAERIEALVAQNFSFVTSPANPSVFADADADNKVVSMPEMFCTFEAGRRIKEIVKQVLCAKKGFAKTVGLCLNNVPGHGYAWVPVWGAGVAAMEGDYSDRELLYVYSMRDIPTKATVELHEVLLVHTFIEMAYWAPNGLGRSLPAHRLISIKSSRCLPLMPRQVLDFLRRSEILAQHFELATKSTKHSPVNCACRNFKKYQASLLMREGRKLREFLVGIYNSKDLRVQIYCCRGPSDELMEYIGMMFREAATSPVCIGS